MLTIILGATVVVQLDGHSASNGAMIPSGTKFTFGSNDPTVATAPADFTTTADAQSLAPIPLTVLAVGSTDISFNATTTDNTPYAGTATLVVNPVPQPGLVSISINLVQTS